MVKFTKFWCNYEKYGLNSIPIAIGRDTYDRVGLTSQCGIRVHDYDTQGGDELRVHDDIMQTMRLFHQHLPPTYRGPNNDLVGYMVDFEATYRGIIRIKFGRWGWMRCCNDMHNGICIPQVEMGDDNF